jgi:hypothetical protein
LAIVQHNPVFADGSAVYAGVYCACVDLGAEVVREEVEKVWPCPAKCKGPVSVAIYVCAFFKDGEWYVGFLEAMS